MTYMTNAPRAVNLDVLADLPVAHPSEGPTAQAASFTGGPTHCSRKKCLGFAPHRKYIRGDAGSNEATSVAKLRLAHQGRVGRDSLVLRTGEEGLESFVASGCAMPIHDAKGVPPFLIFDCISLPRSSISLRFA